MLPFGKTIFDHSMYGERRYGDAQDEDLVIAIPVNMMEKALRGLETL